MQHWFNDNWLKLLAVAMVLGTFYPGLPYVYYQLMNWVVLGAAIVTALQARDSKQPFVAWFFVLVAVVFNPVAPLYLRVDVWQLADLAAALLFFISMFLVRSPKRN